MLFLSSPTAYTVELTEGAMLSNSCAACHGTDGNSPGAIPSIKGKSESFIAQSLTEFRDGKRPSTVMGRHAKGYSLDAKRKFSKQPLFMQGWEKLYPGMIEWVSGNAGGKIESVDVKIRILLTETGDKHKAAVINFIPPQKAGSIVHTAGLTNNDGWCPVNQRSFESTIHPAIHIIGDASIAGKMPKSGFAANSQGKVCAAAIVASVHSIKMPAPSYVNTCYSLVSPDYGISVAAVYRFDKDKGIYKVKGSGGVSPKDADETYRALEARYATGWYDSITSDSFG